MRVERYNVLKLSNAELSIFSKALAAFIDAGGLNADDRSIANGMLRSLEDRFVDPSNGDVRVRSDSGGNKGRQRSDNRNDRNGNRRPRIHHDPLGRGVGRDDDDY